VVVLPNPKQTYKASLLDYDALLELSDRECSYCLSEREVAMLLPFMDYISWRTRYIATETPIDQEVIDNWSGNLARKLMSGCCGDDGLHRFNEDGVYQSSLDGGTTWFDDPENDPRNNATYFPPLEGEDGAEKRCEGASNAQEFLKQNLIDELASGLAYAEIYSTIIGIIAILGITGIGVIIGVVTAAIFVAGVIVVQAAFTSEVWEDLKCILYCNISDDASYTEVQWIQVKNQITLTFTGVVQFILYNWVNALGFVGLTNSARSNMALGADCSECECGDCSNLNDWAVIYGTILEQTPGYLRIASADNGLGQQSCRVANWGGAGVECCAVTYNIITGVATNQAYYPCGSTDPVFSVPPPATCLWDVNVVNVFNAAMEVEFTFTDCP